MILAIEKVLVVSFKSFVSLAFLIAISFPGGDAMGQNFQRDSGGASILLSVTANTIEPYDDRPSDGIWILDEVFSGGAVQAQSSGSGAQANAQMIGSATNLTPDGALTNVPTVDATLGVNLLATTSTNTWAFATVEEAGTGAGGQFTVQGGPMDQFLLHGTLALKGYGIDAAVELSNLSVFPTVFARIGGSFVSAEYGGGNDWVIDGFLQPGVTIVDLEQQGLNDYFNFTIPVSGGTVLDFGSDVTIREAASFYVVAASPGELSRFNYNFAATAWAVLTPLGESPTLGDVDGDGDSDIEDYLIVIQGRGFDFSTSIATLSDGDTNQDGVVDTTDIQNVLTSGMFPGLPGDFDDDSGIGGNDFLSWQRGFGTSPNAQIGDGDADGNGTVDSVDLSIWEAGFGLNLPPALSSPLATVPEPSTASILICLLLIVCFSRGKCRH